MSTQPVHIKDGINYSGYTFVTGGGLVFEGTQQEWSALSENEKSQYAFTVIGGKFGAVYDDGVQEGE